MFVWATTSFWNALLRHRVACVTALWSWVLFLAIRAFSFGQLDVWEGTKNTTVNNNWRDSMWRTQFWKYQTAKIRVAKVSQVVWICDGRFGEKGRWIRAKRKNLRMQTLHFNTILLLVSGLECSHNCYQDISWWLYMCYHLNDMLEFHFLWKFCMFTLFCQSLYKNGHNVFSVASLDVPKQHQNKVVGWYVLCYRSSNFLTCLMLLRKIIGVWARMLRFRGLSYMLDATPTQNLELGCAEWC